MYIYEKFLHKASFIPSTTTFSAVFNAITPGRYNFTNTPACQNVPIIELQRGSIYFLKNISIAGNLPEEDFLGSITVLPQVTLRKSTRPDAVYRFPYTIGKFAQSADAEAWVESNIAGENILISMTGVNQQLPAMVGIVTMSIFVSFHIYAFNDARFAAAFKGAIS